MTNQLRLGDFQLEGPLGAGAMGEVWRAQHLLTGRDVAVKLLTGLRTKNVSHRAAFRDEIHAVSALNHPNVVRIYDYGYALAEDEARAFEVGTPWFATELAEGDLSKLVIDDWSLTYNVIIQILDALAHAHSRGVIHRDLKPQNVLFVNEADRLRLKLADFGIAERYRTPRDFESSNERGSTSGTPTYMPPEQFRGRWRDYAPPTDLYALGCMVYALVTGNPPFKAGTAVGLAMKHLTEDPPPLEPNFGIPDGLASWVLWLLEKQAANRPQTAAEAAFELQQLAGDPMRAPGKAQTADSFSHVADTLVDEAQTTTRLSPVDTAAPTLSALQTVPLSTVTDGAPASEGAPRSGRVPIPEDWSTATFDPSATSAEIGLNLAAVREPPFVHREAERDVLWRRLRAANDTCSPQLAWLHGERGVGKTRLARWLCDRAHELGAAVGFWMTHDSWWESSLALREMLDAALRTRGLSDRDVYERLQMLWGDDFDVAAALELLRPALDDARDDAPVRATFSSRVERFRAVARILARVAGNRVPILVIDDIQWNRSALALVRTIHESDVGFLLLVLSEHGHDDHGHLDAERVRQTVDQLDGEEVELAPFDAVQQELLLRTILPFEPTAASTLAATTEGLPLHAVQAVAASLDRGVVRRDGAGGFLPGEDEQAGSARTVIRRRLDDLAATVPGARDALEVAATQGMRVRRDEWLRAARATDVDVPLELEDVLLVRRLAVAERDGFSFAHGDIRSAIVEGAADSKRWRRYNRAMAGLIDGRASADAAERKARLLLEAAEHAEALEYLLIAVKAHYRTDEYAVAGALLEAALSALETAAVPAGDSRHGEFRVQRARLRFVAGDPDGASEDAEAALRLSLEHGWHSVSSQALELTGRLAVNIDGDIERAVRSYDEGLAAAALAGDPLLEARIREGLSFISVHHRGNAEEAREHLTRARELFEQFGDARDLVNLQIEEALVLRMEGDLAAAKEHLEACCEQFERTGYRYAYGIASNVLGDVQRMLGDVDAAVISYEEARRICELIGTSTVEVDINLGIVELERENYDRARELLTPIADYFRTAGYAVPLAYTLSGLAPCDVADGDLEAYDSKMKEVLEVQSNAHIVDPDFAALLRASADQLWAAGDDRCKAVYAVCATQYETLGDGVAAGLCRARAEELAPT